MMKNPHTPFDMNWFMVAIEPGKFTLISMGKLGIHAAISRAPGRPLESQGGYQARAKIHVIRVVFSGPGTVRAYIV